LDAIRNKYSRPVVFLVHELMVGEDWAWAAVTGTIDGRPEYEGDGYVLHRVGGAWKVVDSVNASDPSVVEQRYRELRDQFPKAPIP